MSSTPSSTDRIERQVLLNAPRERVWRAISDSKEFSAWFLSDFDAPFVPGARVGAKCRYPGYEHLRFEIWVERVEPQRYLSYRWHPNAIDPKLDYSKEPTTLVEFRLEDAPGEGGKKGTLLTVTESGFDGIPVARRAEAFKGNTGGWEFQVKAIAEWLDAHP